MGWNLIGGPLTPGWFCILLRPSGSSMPTLHLPLNRRSTLLCYPFTTTVGSKSHLN